jgi:putative oxidoreductase
MSAPPAATPGANEDVRKWYIAVRARLEGLPLSIMLLAMRIGVGSVFFKAGLLKYQSFEFAVKLFEDEYKVPILSPAVAARITMFNELTWPIFLFLGLATRFATLPILGSIAVIQLFVYPSAWTENLVWASILVMLLTRGAGALSLDFLVEQFFEKRTARSQTS